MTINSPNRYFKFFSTLSEDDVKTLKKKTRNGILIEDLKRCGCLNNMPIPSSGVACPITTSSAGLNRAIAAFWEADCKLQGSS